MLVTTNGRTRERVLYTCDVVNKRESTIKLTNETELVFAKEDGLMYIFVTCQKLGRFIFRDMIRNTVFGAYVDPSLSRDAAQA